MSILSKVSDYWLVRLMYLFFGLYFFVIFRVRDDKILDVWLVGIIINSMVLLC